MTFQLHADESVAAGIKRGVRRQGKKACRELEKLDDEQAVHDLRKRFKRIRAVARLPRPEIGDKSFRKVNGSIRDAGRSVAPLRDAKVLVSAMGKLLQHQEHEFSGALEPIQRKLEADYQSVRAGLADDRELRQQVVECIDDALQEAKHWKIPGRGWHAVRAGLEQTYELARQAYLAASIDPSVDNLHEWRKQVKYQLYQFEFIERLRPRSLRRRAKQLSKLADFLGNDHDLAVLAQTITAEEKHGGRGQFMVRVAQVIHASREHLQDKALDLGRRTYHQAPAEFLVDLKGSRHAAHTAKAASG